MADYSHLSVMTVKVDRTSDYTFENIPGQPILRVRFAGEANKPYYNEVLRRADHLAKRKLKISTDLIRDNRDRDRELYPKHIVVGWPRAPLDKDGKQNPFSKEEVEAWLRAVPDDVFDELREHCRDANNFRDSMDTAGVAGNSQTV